MAGRESQPEPTTRQSASAPQALIPPVLKATLGRGRYLQTVRPTCDVVVIGSGPNGLAAAIVAAQRGLSVRLYEAHPYVGGGLRSAELTAPGFTNDACASVLPMGAASPFLRSLPLGPLGFEWLTPEAAAAHPLDDGSAAMLWNELGRTCSELGRDGPAWNRAIGTTARDWHELEADILAPVGIPRHPLTYTRFGLGALRTADGFARGNFGGAPARALFAGVAGHGVTPFTFAGSAAVGIVLSATAHVRGWPVVRGGSQKLADALVAHFRSLGGEIVTGTPIASFDQLPQAKHYFFDTTPRALAAILGDRVPASFARTAQAYPHGPGVFKVDWALREPIPWRASDCAKAATVHVGGTLEEIASAEAAPWRGEHAERPFMLVTQPSVVDATRAPAGQHTAWGYCHVPNGSRVDMTARIEAQMERFAPGFRDVVIARTARTPQMLEADNANLVGGDIGGGANTLANILFRPTWRHYNTGVPNVHLCSASTPPGGGVHGMCGYHAATRVLGR